jgi:hypothetical protein
MVRESEFRIPAWTRDFSLHLNGQTLCWCKAASYLMDTGIIYWSQIGQGLSLTTHFRLVPNLKIGDSVPFRSLYAFIASTGEN